MHCAYADLWTGECALRMCEFVNKGVHTVYMWICEQGSAHCVDLWRRECALWICGQGSMHCAYADL